MILLVLLAAFPAASRPARATPARAAPAAPIKVMPLGDSITSGTDASYPEPIASYRCELYKKFDAGSVDFVGSVHGQWGVNIGHPLLPPPSYCPMGDLDEEGHSGYDIAHILTGAPTWPGKLQDWATTYQPDVVLVHLGTNNFSGNPDFPPPNVDDAINQMGQVIDTLRAANPRVRILLAQILPCKCDAQNLIPDFNSRSVTLAASKQRPYAPIVIVDMNTNFLYDRDFYPDGVHLNPDGENRMAGRWKAGFDKIMAINHWAFVPLAVK